MLVIERPRIGVYMPHIGPYRFNISPFSYHISHLQGPYWSLRAPNRSSTDHIPYWPLQVLWWSSKGPIVVLTSPIWVPTGYILIIYRPNIDPCTLHTGAHWPHIGHLQDSYWSLQAPYWSSVGPILILTEPILVPTGPVLVIYGPSLVYLQAPYWSFQVLY